VLEDAILKILDHVVAMGDSGGKRIPQDCALAMVLIKVKQRTADVDLTI
jgi:hypothetical protein